MIMKNLSPAWLSAELEAQMDSLPIPVMKKEIDDVSDCDTINIKIRRNLSDAESETYELKIVKFDHVQP